VHALDGGDQTVREAHAPGKGGGDSVVAIAGQKATDAADSIAEGGGWRTGVEDCEKRDRMARRGIMSGDSPGDECECGEASDQAAEPCESVGAEQLVYWIGENFGGRFEQMVQLGADEPGKARK